MNRRLFLLAGILAGVTLLSLGVGSATLSPTEAWDGLLSGLGLASAPRVDEAVIWELRLPRTLAVLMVGECLAAAGVGLRGVYRNPMAEPYLLGISSAAGLGVVIGSLFTPAGVPPVAGAILGAAAAATMALATRRLSVAAGGGNRLILLGVALGLTYLAWTVLIVYVGDSPRLPTFTYFVFGSFGAVTWRHLLVTFPLAVFGTAVIAARARSLELMALGDSQARSLGVDVRRATTWVLVAAGIATGASVAIAGVIGFVGLVAPYLAVRVSGPHHERLLPAAMAIGAIFLLLSDIVARSVAGPVEVPVGIVAAAVGGLLLTGLLLRSRTA
ncbi:MAG: iron ABC transporter permease [Acidimicrobiia bacterium]